IVQDNSRGHRGAANGLYMGINFLTTAAVTVFVGWLADLFGLKAAFTTSALLGLAGIPIIFILPKSSKSISKKMQLKISNCKSYTGSILAFTLP
ncbi:MAG: hypothetical protein KAV87_31745, partial [Desulfobacteraceae bacterium]|nr:hypothetical protein [Desulfobacteraceae bacterium]